jgi:type I restriction enzyme S subunit
VYWEKDVAFNSQKYRIADLITQQVLTIGDGYRAKNSELGVLGLPFARAGNINNGFNFEEADRFPEENLFRVGDKVSRVGDVVFTSKGTVGRFSQVSIDTPKFVYSPQLCYWRVLNPEFIEPRFLYFWMRGSEFFLQYTAVKGQTDMADYVSLADQRRMHITLPPLPEQRAIAAILGSLDDKIELNRKTNATLEEIARTLFTSWFVEFAPVRAKAAGHAPQGMDAETAALFPDSFEDSPLGAVPRGWRMGTLGEIASNVRRGVQPDSIVSDTPYIGLEHMPRRSIALAEWGNAGDVTSNKSIFNQGDMLFGKLRPYFHKVGVAIINGVCSTDILVIAPKSSEWFGIALSYLSSDALINYTDAASAGTKMPRTNWSDLAKYPIVLPPANIAKHFNEQILPMIQKIRSNILATRELAQMRDTLLPKLLSGALRVKDIEGSL